jgi:DNA-binding transcriptional MocR family regulator
VVSGSTLSGGAPAQFSSTLIEHILRSGALQTHLENVLIPTYRTRAKIMRQAVEEILTPLGVQLGQGAAEDGILGGFFLYLTLPPHVVADEVAAVALKEYNLRLLTGGMMAVRGSTPSSPLLARGVRLCWAWEEADLIVEGMSRLAAVLREKFLSKDRTEASQP